MTILFCFGTRPEALKLAPIVRECRALGLDVKVWCANQSPDLLDRTVLPWDYAPGIGEDDFAFGEQAAKKPTTYPRLTPHLVVVQGDTRSGFRAAVAAYEAGIKVMHVEAGVRSGNLSSPWPEEGYRKMISQIASYHACTTEHNSHNLLRERVGGWYEGDLHAEVPVVDTDVARVTGSPVVESVRERARGLRWGDGQLVDIVTLHRRENREHFRDILQAINDTHLLTHVDCVRPELPLAWYTHPNGWAKEAFAAVENKSIAWNIQPPADSKIFAAMLRNARMVITDSGGVVEECNAIGTRSVQVRSVTDRPECLGAGGSFLGGVTRNSVVAAIKEAARFDRSTIRTDIYGDGLASVRLAEWIKEIVA